jgi:hypothetical protein
MQTDRNRRLKCFFADPGFKLRKQVLRVGFYVGGLATAFAWHENSAEKAAQFCHFDLEK